MKLDSLTDLYHEQLRDLYSSEQQIIEALPEMAEVASHAELKRAFGKHLDETRAHSERLKQIFDRLDEVPTGQLCEATQGLVSEAREIILAKGDDAVRDAGLIACAQRIEHYEIADYGCAHTFAKALGEEAAGLLAQTLKEEKDSDERFTSLAEQVVNPHAKRTES